MAQLCITQGDSASWTGTVTTGRGVLVDISNSTLVFSVKETEDADNYLFQKTSDVITEIELTAPTSGEFVLYIEPTDTSELSAGFYPYDIEITFLNGRKRTLVKDFFIIELDIT